jgi:hypothetical protein
MMDVSNTLLQTNQHKGYHARFTKATKNEAILHQMVVEFNQSESLEQLETFEEDRMVIHNAIATMAASDPCAIVGEWVGRRW